jgi:hypothetical protein
VTTCTNLVTNLVTSKKTGAVCPLGFCYLPDFIVFLDPAVGIEPTTN